ncbi:hypothetical protein AM493_18200 [Flavobacterium akiainvivens]|uniref:Uncharacterized protein n=1 Tax=Flavobacterium akiainvivens TaxID=1202724 RepID=A0A0M8MKL9_9FLAO|nr:hypothetical protein [Flavobacterium akiainvivens]KOS07767.1 hypothetical protein AM493_18200 [Flavobacterium akiainvivens]SFQ25903.1 hypothetical protein SAMN05444144_102221 [Flavobacterium akiainvivens]
MKLHYLFICLISAAMHAQSLSPSVNRDSLFKSLITRFNGSLQEEYNREYQGTPPGKEQDFLLFVMSQPQGSKKAMQDNMAKKQPYFNQLLHLFSPMVPQEHSIGVFFNPANALFNIPESIDILIYGPIPGTDLEMRNMAPNSADLSKTLKRLNWTPQDLENVRVALQKAGCIGIQNGYAATEVTYAANLRERFSYIIFNQEVSPATVKEYVTDCTAVAYNERVVLQYRGAVGTECFPQ